MSLGVVLLVDMRAELTAALSKIERVFSGEKRFAVFTAQCASFLLRPRKETKNVLSDGQSGFFLKWWRVGSDNVMLIKDACLVFRSISASNCTASTGVFERRFELSLRIILRRSRRFFFHCESHYSTEASLSLLLFSLATGVFYGYVTGADETERELLSFGMMG